MGHSRCGAGPGLRVLRRGGFLLHLRLHFRLCGRRRHRRAGLRHG